MRFLLLIFLLCFLRSYPLSAQDWNITIPKEIVILQSTKDYNTALKTAKEAAIRLGKKLDLEDNHPNKKTGLSLTKADCEGSAYDYPCYTARGDGAADNSDYISIEYSNAYEGFAKGYYIVVAGIGDPGSASVKAATANSRKWYKDAYAKRTKVWRGCMH